MPSAERLAPENRRQRAREFRRRDERDPWDVLSPCDVDLHSTKSLFVLPQGHRNHRDRHRERRTVSLSPCRPLCPLCLCGKKNLSLSSDAFFTDARELFGVDAVLSQLRE